MLREGKYDRPEISELLLQCPEEKVIQNSEKSSSKENVDDHLAYAHKGGTLQDGIIAWHHGPLIKDKKVRAPPALN